ncbi:MAG: phospholipase D-like domain-containing protein [Ferruginibacter sp.]
MEGMGGAVVRSRYASPAPVAAQQANWQVRVLPDEAFGLMHGKAGVITQLDGGKSAFLGSANESRSAWQVNYELIWEDTSLEAVAWVQTEFDALWSHPQARPLADAIIQEMERLADRSVIATVEAWQNETADTGANPGTPNPAAPIIETPVYRSEVGLLAASEVLRQDWSSTNTSSPAAARRVLCSADQVGLGQNPATGNGGAVDCAFRPRAHSDHVPQSACCSSGRTRCAICSTCRRRQWDGRQWVDETRHTLSTPAVPRVIRKCPRRVGHGLQRSDQAHIRGLRPAAASSVTPASSWTRRTMRAGATWAIARIVRCARRRTICCASWARLPSARQSVLLATATPVQTAPR